MGAEESKHYVYSALKMHTLVSLVDLYGKHSNKSEIGIPVSRK